MYLRINNLFDREHHHYRRYHHSTSSRRKCVNISNAILYSHPYSGACVASMWLFFLLLSGRAMNVNCMKHNQVMCIISILMDISISITALRHQRYYIVIKLSWHPSNVKIYNNPPSSVT